jgi:hypothetical protein
MTRWGRDYLRMHGVYEVVRVLHEQETNDAVLEHDEHLVNLLKCTEGPETAATRPPSQRRHRPIPPFELARDDAMPPQPGEAPLTWPTSSVVGPW